MTFLLSIIIRQHQSSSVYLYLHFIVCLRILTFSSYDTSADPLLEQLNWKRLDTQRQIQVATMVYKSIHGLAPDYLGSLFTKYNPPYNLRNSENKLAVPLPRTSFLKNSFSYNGAVIWNSFKFKFYLTSVTSLHQLCGRHIKQLTSTLLLNVNYCSNSSLTQQTAAF